MKGYAYLDSVGILHAVVSPDVAGKYARGGKYIETENCDGAGYLDENGYNVMVYADEKKFSYGKRNGKEYQVQEDEFAKKFPVTYTLYKELAE